jgi:hypothetical protein
MRPMFSIDTEKLKDDLAVSNCWNKFDHRRQGQSPHREVSDIWVRYCDPSAMTAGPHESVWYPTDFDAQHIVKTILNLLGADQLGGVLITKIPAGKSVYPHKDFGWHATHYQKLAVCIAANHEQSFNFEGEEMRSEDGDCFTFDNHFTHWVSNPSQEERITMIVCYRNH